MLKIDTERALVIEETPDGEKVYPMASPEAFERVSQAWLRCGWDTKHVYSFTWMGRPIIQLPEDMIRLQEVIYRVKPDVIIETGVAHGGSLIYYASLFKGMGHPGRVIGIDIEIRPHNRAAIEAHEMMEYITLIEGSSVDAAVVAVTKSHLTPQDKVLVLLDSNHSYDHVLKELQLYSSMVTTGSYIVATDGIMGDLVGAPRSQADWGTNNPRQAAQDFLRGNNNFVLETPAFEFNEGLVRNPITYWPGAWLKRVN